METLIILVIVILLFAAAFISKRRFGLLGLALAAGSILSGIWSYEAGLIPSLFSIPSGSLTSAVVSSVIILLPVALLLFHGYSYKTLISRVVGASLLTVLAMAFLVEPISHVLVIQGVGASAFNWLLDNRTTIIGVGLILSIVDLFFTKSTHMSDKHHKH